MEARLNKL